MKTNKRTFFIYFLRGNKVWTTRYSNKFIITIYPIKITVMSIMDCEICITLWFYFIEMFGL